MNSLKAIWSIIYEALEKKYPPSVISFWFNNFELVHLDETRAFITTTSTSYGSILSKQYGPAIEKIFEESLGFRVAVTIFDKEGFHLESALAADTPAAIPAAAPAATAPSTPAQSTAEPAPAEVTSSEIYIPDNDFTFENFIVGGSNSLAHAISLAVAMHPAENYNPLLLYGASGLGKTHLMRAIANRVKQNHPEFKIIFVKSEDFTNELIRALAQKTTSQFKDKYRSADMLLIDDIQFIAGKHSVQEEFFHTFNTLYDAGKQIVLTSDRPPKDIQLLEERIQSRFEGGIIIDVQPPDTELRIAILQSKAQMMNVKLSDEVFRFLGENVKSNIRQLEGVIKKLGAFSFVNGGNITVDIARSVLSGVITGTKNPNLIAEQIINSVSKHYGVPVEEIKGKKRSNDIAKARHVAVYSIRRVTDMSLQNIAKLFGRDHSTVVASLDVVKSKMAEDSSFEYEVNSICEEFA